MKDEGIPSTRTIEKRVAEGVDESVFPQIATLYNLPSLAFVGTPEKGISSHNVILQTPDGTRFFLKQYKTNDAERRENASRVERYVLDHSSVPVVAPLLSASGESHVFLEGRMYALFEYKEDHESGGETPAEGLHRAFSLAATLGKIHRIPPPEQGTVLPIDMWEAKSAASKIERLLRIKDVILAKNEYDDFDKRSLQIIEEKLVLLESSQDSGGVPYPPRICHGDYHAANTIIDSHDNVIGVCDWDTSGISNPYIDLMNSFIGAVIGKRYASYASERSEMAQAFMRGYQSESDLEMDGVQLKNAVDRLARVMVGSSWPMYDHYFHNHTKADRSLERVKEKAAFFTHHQDEIVDFMMNASKKADRD